MSILEDANSVIAGDRENTYGDSGKNLRNIAAYWNTYLGSRGQQATVDAVDVCNMMTLLKIARLGGGRGRVWCRWPCAV